MLCACGGDPRLEFAGNYRGTATFTYTDFNDIMSENVEFIISAPKASERLVFEVSCEFKAVPTGPDAISTDPVSCPPHVYKAQNGSTATFTDNWEKGSGAMVGDTLTTSQTGEQLGTDYSDGSRDERFLIRRDMVLTKI